MQCVGYQPRPASSYQETNSNDAAAADGTDSASATQRLASGAAARSGAESCARDTGGSIGGVAYDNQVTFHSNMYRLNNTVRLSMFSSKYTIFRAHICTTCFRAFTLFSSCTVGRNLLSLRILKVMSLVFESS